MADREHDLARAEEDFAQAVAQALAATADEFADAVREASELVAARFSVGRIASMWTGRVHGLVRRLLGTAQTAAGAAAEDVHGELPAGWDDLPGRYGQGRPLPDGMAQYVTVTEHLLRAVGDRLAQAARRELATGLDAGEDIAQLHNRLRAAFDREGAQLGAGREARIARTEASRVWNAATLAAAQAAAGPGRPVVKQWITRHDRKVRTAHSDADGQLRLLNEAFMVGGVPMQHPGDPAAPASLVIHCRCRLAVAPQQRACAYGLEVRSAAGPRESAMSFHGTQGRPSYRKYHPGGKGGARASRKTLHENGGWLGSSRFTEEEHQQAVYRYTRSWYGRMNSWLRTRTPSDNEQSQQLVEQRVAALNDLINIQDPSRSETTLYRRMENHRLELNEGDEFHDRGFLSTSSRSDIGGIAGMDADDPNYSLFTITVPAGAQMLDVASVGEDDDEAEVILPPGTKFRVRKVGDNDPTQPRRYEVEVINAVTSTLGSPRAPRTDVSAAAGDPGFQERVTWQDGDVVIDKRANEGSVEVSRSVTAAAGGHTGAMIALMPTAEDAERLALNATGSEPADELHLTLFYLGEGADWDDEHRADLIDRLRARAPDVGEAVAARAFGANQWNADGDEPCWVWSVGDDRDRPQDAPTLETARWAATYALEDMHRQPELPAQQTPWQPHVCAAYTRSPSLLTAMNQRLGPIRFDRLRVAFAGDTTDIPLGPQETAVADQPSEHVTAPPDAGPRVWSTPGDTAIAFENQETGDGRVFAPGALYWEGPGPWPLQHAEEMLMGHQGAELAGSIQALARDGDRITATGVLYPGRPAGADALMLLEEGAPLGVSVDLDDVSMEFVDRTLGTDENGDLVLLASLPCGSLLRLEDGSWAITATATAEWTASGATLSRTSTGMQLITGPGGTVTREALEAAFGSRLTAAAGDPDSPDGVLVHSEESGDFIVRITRARLRGATLVAMPAYAQARIVLDDAAEPGAQAIAAASGPSDAHREVVRYVKSSPVPVGARDVAKGLGMRMETARGHLARAAKAGRIVRIAMGLYVGPVTEGPDADLSATSGTELEDLEASAWSAMKAADPMPAAWFREPTEDELPPGSGGVHYADGRVYGWVAQAGEPHAGYTGRNLTIESLGDLDLTHFLRARFRLDDGSEVRAGAFTMNAPHHRDGAECESAACQFDDTRTVAGIVTVGMSDKGLWFSGAAAPWLSEWDRQVFAACQPSYHMKQGRDGRWQLRAVLSVPVPGHSSPLLATAVAVAERSNLALAASTAGALTVPDLSGHSPDTSADRADAGADANGRIPSGLGGHRPDNPDTPVRPGQDPAGLLADGRFLDELLAALDRRQEQRQQAARDEAAALATSIVAPARADLVAGRTITQEGTS
ncbi:ADP-ribosyltransferase [Streptomyces sp. HPF1205]|uniref:ADP-ribosyltransferase n=1 Tax=Streptomyces sp. HPF1205 TaxID=2873262 RepID=UPI001CEC0099|nr:ADP-ribosyltransferase [Streptomyces sp. HPF1205]